MKDAIIYDSVNRIVWHTGQTGKGKTAKQVFGKDYKKFGSNVQARSYAIKLGKKNNLDVYDKYYGTYLQNKKSNILGNW
jgi:hypothetical protein